MVFYFVTTGWILEIGLCVNSINQSINDLSQKAEKVCLGKAGLPLHLYVIVNTEASTCYSMKYPLFILFIFLLLLSSPFFSDDGLADYTLNGNYPNKEHLLYYRDWSTGCHVPHGLLSCGLALH